MRRLRNHRSVVSSVFLTIVHAFIFSHLDYCSSLYAGLPEIGLSSLQSVLNSAVSLVRLVIRLPSYSRSITFRAYFKQDLQLHKGWKPARQTGGPRKSEEGSGSNLRKLTIL